MTPPTAAQQPFSGFKVLDLTQGVAGPYATMLLGLNGADVLKVEPLDGDWARRLGAVAGQQSVNFLAYNRAKRSLAIDLKSDAGRKAMAAALEQCDIVVESFRPGVVKRLGLGYEDAVRIRPEVVYASVSGFGQSGPDTGRAAVDTLMQAYSGMMQMNASASGEPHRSGMIIVDALTGLFAYQAVSASVLRRARFGGGEYLDISMMQTAAAFQTSKIMEYQQAGGSLAPLYVPAGMFKTADGHIVVSGMRKAHFSAICNVTGHPELADDPRWPNQYDRVAFADEINGKLQSAFLQASSQSWLEKLAAAGVMAERVRSYGEWLREPQVGAVGSVAWVDTDGFGNLPVARVPGILPRDDVEGVTQPPRIGEQSMEILGELGFDNRWIVQQVAAGSVGISRRAQRQ